MKLEAVLAAATERIPSFLRGVLMLLPDGIPLGHVGGKAYDLEPLVRAVRRVLALRATPAVHSPVPAAFCEYTFVTPDELVVVEASRGNRIALAAVCDRDSNLAFVTAATRSVMSELERELDLRDWGL